MTLTAERAIEENPKLLKRYDFDEIFSNFNA